MEVKTLISQLLEMPMNAKVILSIQDEETADYKYYEHFHVVDYEDGDVGLLCPVELQEENKC